jgi:membrane protein
MPRKKTGKPAKPVNQKSTTSRKTRSGRILQGIYEKQFTDNTYILAAGVAFFGMFAIFPGITTLISLYGLVSDPVQVQQQIAGMQEIIPYEAYRIISQQITDIVSAPARSLGIGFAGGLILTLWGASRGMKALIIALNVAYNAQENRGFIRLNLMSMFFTICAVLFVIVSLFLIVALPPLLDIFKVVSDVIFEHQDLIFVSRWVLLAVFTIFGLTLIYRYAPCTGRTRWEWFNWGAVAVTIFWLLGSYLFSLYVSHFGNYNETYGSMGAVIILLMWFYLTSYLILLGGQLNAEIEKQHEAQMKVDKLKNLQKQKHGH